MAMRYPAKDPWDGSKEYLTSWLEQLEESFVLEDVSEDRKKVAALLSYIGRYGYEILKNLSAPKKPSESKYDELCKTLKKSRDP